MGRRERFCSGWRGWFFLRWCWGIGYFVMLSEAEELLADEPGDPNHPDVFQA
ncbi:hypothetical protein [Bifidobacterium oedipodis]|uniref:hypothetical protein n=1 Tax=Bifidobacterium oedipodis TaxID=2675322 RepID=UPI00145ED831|nr:hypothetical protein [Bifidobacterium sp. DSM 109957]